MVFWGMARNEDIPAIGISWNKLRSSAVQMFAGGLLQK
jgi:hypothetical protein